MNNEADNLADVWDKHLESEFEKKDVDAAMTTMSEEPYVHCVPTLTGGRGFNGVYDFYKNHFIGKTPKDLKIAKVSRTVGKDQVVEEFILSFTHDVEFEYLLPGVPPTGKYVEIPHIAVVKFKIKISHEHLYWDQASVLVQIGLLKPEKIPISGIEQTKKLVELSKKD